MRDWIGCYGSPGVCVSAIKAMVEKRNMQSELAQELFDEFEASLRRKPGHEQTVFTICAAPDFRLLTKFGGSMDLETYHAKYNHELQVAIYKQELPRRAMTEVEGDTASTTAAGPQVEDSAASLPSNAPKQWRKTRVRIGSKDESVKETVPRGLSGVISWLRAMAEKSD
jgi:hypothetical protein